LRTLIIAEKPSAGREIAEALGATKKASGALESSQYVVTWAAGHLVSLKEPHEYKEEWKYWNLRSLPIIPEKYELKVVDDKKSQFEIIKRYLLAKDIDRVVNACDAGREGELIFDYIYRLAGSRIPAFRLWTSAALTPDAINREFKKLKPIEEFNGLRLAARARSAADWSIGMNATRAISLAAQKSGSQGVYSVGRVQTPTLQFLVAREEEIRNFKIQKFWTLTADLTTHDNVDFKGRYEYQKEDGITHQIFSQDLAKKVISECEGKNAKVVKVDSKENSIPPPLLFDLTDLQKECNKRFSLNSDKTLEVTQGLYEKHKCISYPRTEYRHLTEDNRESIPGILQGLKGSFSEKFLDQVKGKYQSQNKRIFDNSKVGDHHALIPTSKKPNSLNEVEQKVYDLIANRFLAAFADDFKYTSSVIVSDCEKNLFISRGKITKNQGWKQIEQDLEEDGKKQDQEDQKLPDVTIGNFVQVKKLNLKEDKTKPPPRYNDATLLSAMQNPASKTDSKDEKSLLRECGLGTPATRASIIKRLETTKYIEREKKNIKPTDKAFELMGLLKKFNQVFLSNPIMTAEWERTLQEIEKDATKAIEFSKKLTALTCEVTSNVKNLILGS
jgi:DNA topoisomerase-3